MKSNGTFKSPRNIGVVAIPGWPLSGVPLYRYCSLSKPFRFKSHWLIRISDKEYASTHFDGPLVYVSTRFYCISILITLFLLSQFKRYVAQNYRNYTAPFLYVASSAFVIQEDYLSHIG